MDLYCTKIEAVAQRDPSTAIVGLVLVGICAAGAYFTRHPHGWLPKTVFWSCVVLAIVFLMAVAGSFLPSREQRAAEQGETSVDDVNG
jgi:drug/metabolite transporter (DMT)-like permease